MGQIAKSDLTACAKRWSGRAILVEPLPQQLVWRAEESVSTLSKVALWNPTFAVQLFRI